VSGDERLFLDLLAVAEQHTGGLDYARARGVPWPRPVGHWQAPCAALVDMRRRGLVTSERVGRPALTFWRLRAPGA
jgi:hypothetical protein